jgi:hypothetical protein
MLSSVLRSKVWFVVSLFVCLPILFVLTGAGNSYAAQYAVDKGSDMYSFTAGVVSAAGDLYEEGGDGSTTILVMPSFAHFAMRNFAVGGDLLLMHSKQGDTGTSVLGLGPKAMYCFGRENSKAYPFLTAAVYYVTYTIDYGRVSSTTSGTRVKLGAGSIFGVRPHLGILAEVSYNIDNLKEKDAKKSMSGNMIIAQIGLVGFSF